MTVDPIAALIEHPYNPVKTPKELSVEASTLLTYIKLRGIATIKDFERVIGDDRPVEYVGELFHSGNILRFTHPHIPKSVNIPAGTNLDHGTEYFFPASVCPKW